MRKVFVIALRDYNAAVRTKGFIVGLVFLPLMMLGSFGVQWLLKDRVDTGAKHFAVIDRTAGESIVGALEAAARVRNETQLRDATGQQVKPVYVLERLAPPDTKEATDELRLEQSQRIRRGELAGVIEIGPDVEEVAPPKADQGNFDVAGAPADL